MPYDPETGEWIEPEAQGENSGGEPRTNSEWAQFRQEQRARKEAERQANEAARELAFYKAGIDPSKDPKLGFFMKGYDGKIDADSIRQAALDAGFLEPPAPDPAAVAAAQQQAAENADAQAASRRIDNASQGATPPPVDPSTLIEDAFRKGGDAALLDALSAQGIPIAYEGVIQE